LGRIETLGLRAATRDRSPCRVRASFAIRPDDESFRRGANIIEWVASDQSQSFEARRIQHLSILWVDDSSGRDFILKLPPVSLYLDYVIDANRSQRAEESVPVAGHAKIAAGAWKWSARDMSRP
jgi:hypothetical protein